MPTTAPDSRLTLLPGLGADDWMFEPQRAAFPQLQVPGWIEPRPCESVAEFARRMAGSIDTTPPYFFGGASFGGMVALEVAQHLKPAPLAVFLIASCRSYRSIPGPARMLGRLARLAPRPLFDSVHARTIGLSIRAFGDMTREQRRGLRAMMRRTPPAFVQWGGAALAQWTGPADLPMPVFHVHGAADWVIPYRRVRPDVIVPGAGHLVNVTHADEVNRFLRERMEATLPSPLP